MSRHQSLTPESPLDLLSPVERLRVYDLDQDEYHLEITAANLALKAAGTRIMAGEVVKQG